MLGYSATIYRIRQGVDYANVDRIGEVPHEEMTAYLRTLTVEVIVDVPYAAWVDHLLKASEEGRARLLHGGGYPFLFLAQGSDIKSNFARTGIQAIATLDDNQRYLLEAWDQS